MKPFLTSPTALAFVASSAFAVGATPAAAEAPAEAPLPTAARERDASIDRGVLSSHAETIGADRWSINSYELFLVGVTYGFTDDFQMSVTAFVPVVPELLALGLAAKYVVTRQPSHVVAFRGLVGVSSNLAGAQGFGVGVVGAGPAIDYYFDAEQRYAFHGGVLAGGLFSGGFGGGAGSTFSDDVALIVEAGFSLGVDEHVKLLVEGQLVTNFSTSNGFDLFDIGLVNYGVRFHGDAVALDIALMRPVGDVDLGGWALGFPFLGFSGRF